MRATPGAVFTRRAGAARARVDQPGQYHNPTNRKPHQKWTAKQIWAQTGGRIGVFCAGLGTTGTIIGNARYLKQKRKTVQIVGAMREDTSYVPGVRTRGLLRLIGFDWGRHVDDIQKVTTVDSYRTSMALSRRGIVVGPSAGFAMAGLLQYLEGRKQGGALDELRDRTARSSASSCAPTAPSPTLTSTSNTSNRQTSPRSRTRSC